MYIHIADFIDNNVRMILPPSSDGVAPTIVYTYTVSGLGDALNAMTFDGTHIHISDTADNNVRMILPPTSGGVAPTIFTYTVSGLNAMLLPWHLMAHISTLQMSLPMTMFV